VVKAGMSPLPGGR